MNTKFVLASVFAAMSGLAGVNNTAKAGSDFHVSLNLGLRPAPVMLVAPAYGVPVAPVIIEPRREEPRGYWKEIVVKTWVPARWVVSYVAHGRELRRYEPGYFAYNTDRVWVALDRDRDYVRAYDRGHDYDRGFYRRG